MPDDRELHDTQASGPAAGRPAPRHWPPSTSWWSRARARPSTPTTSWSRSRSACCSGWPSAGSAWWSSWPSSPTCCPCPTPTSRTTPPSTPRPSIHHLLGTDDLGRDLLSRLIFGARVSLVVGFGAVAIGMLVGGTLGLISGYKGGRLDVALNAGAFVLLAFPAIVAVIAIVAFWGAVPVQDHHHHRRGHHPPPLPGGPGLQPVLRQPGLRGRGPRPWGPPRPRIVFREILPNVIPVAVTFGLITVAGVIVIEGSLAFLGLSVPLPTAVVGEHDLRGRRQRQPAAPTPTS